MVDYYKQILKNKVSELTNEEGFTQVLEAFTELFEEYAKGFEDEEERVSTEKVAKKVREAVDALTSAGI